MISCLILGSGPAGYTAAIYAGRAGLNPVIYEGIQPGGQLTITTEVENFPGFPEGIDANELMENMRQQALRFGARIESHIAVKADLSASPYKVWFDDGSCEECLTLIIATGATAKYLGLDDEKKYQGIGVSACATCDGFFYRKKTVAVVGGGDTIAGETAKALAAEFDVTLVFCFELAGVLADPDDEASVIAHINAETFETLKRDGIVVGGMIPKIENSLAAVRAGVKRVIITRADALGTSKGTTIE